MVLYLDDGKVNKVHDDYLEDEAKKNSEDVNNRYKDQIEVCNAHDANAGRQKNLQCFITIKEQKFARLYTRSGCAVENIPEFDTEAKENIPNKGLDRRTLMKCSALADEYFRFNPKANTLFLPVSYPRQHLNSMYYGTRGMNEYNAAYPKPIEPGKKYKYQYDEHRAHIRAREIECYIIPWIREMEKVVNNKEEKNQNIEPKKLPKIERPKDLLEKIHLYNAMLQLGLPDFIQKPLIDALIQQMRQTKLQDCHLSTLEITICRFHSLGIPILDPVLSHFIGTFSERELSDRQNPESSIDRKKRKKMPKHDREDSDTIYYYRAGLKRELLNYTSFRVGRKRYRRDTALVPPELEVLGHSIRHWSGVRRDGSTSAVQYSLNVKRVEKSNRKD